MIYDTDASAPEASGARPFTNYELRITIAEFGALRADTAKFEFLAGLLPLSDGNAWGMS